MPCFCSAARSNLQSCPSRTRSKWRRCIVRLRSGTTLADFGARNIRHRCCFGARRNGARFIVTPGPAHRLWSWPAYPGGAARFSAGSYGGFRLAAVPGALFVWRSRGDRLVVALSTWFGPSFYRPSGSKRRTHAFLGRPAIASASGDAESIAHARTAARGRLIAGAYRGLHLAAANNCRTPADSKTEHE